MTNRKTVNCPIIILIYNCVSCPFCAQSFQQLAQQQTTKLSVATFHSLWYLMNMTSSAAKSSSFTTRGHSFSQLYPLLICVQQNWPKWKESFKPPPPPAAPRSPFLSSIVNNKRLHSPSTSNPPKRVALTPHQKQMRKDFAECMEGVFKLLTGPLATHLSQATSHLDFELWLLGRLIYKNNSQVSPALPKALSFKLIASPFFTNKCSMGMRLIGIGWYMSVKWPPRSPNCVLLNYPTLCLLLPPRT